MHTTFTQASPADRVLCAALRERINRAGSADEFRAIVRDMMDKARRAGT